jgi:hypothetical protein
MALVDVYALEADYKVNRRAYDDSMNAINYGPPPKKSAILNAAQLNADLQSTLLQLSSHLPEIEGFNLISDDLKTDYDKLVGDSSTIAIMHYSHYIVWLLVAAVLLGLYFRT